MAALVGLLPHAGVASAIEAKALSRRVAAGRPGCAVPPLSRLRVAESGTRPRPAVGRARRDGAGRDRPDTGRSADVDPGRAAHERSARPRARAGGTGVPSHGLVVADARRRRRPATDAAPPRGVRPDDRPGRARGGLGRGPPHADAVADRAAPDPGPRGPHRPRRGGRDHRRRDDLHHRRPGVGRAAPAGERGAAELPERARHAGRRGFCRRRDALSQPRSAAAGLRAAAHVRGSLGMEAARSNRTGAGCARRRVPPAPRPPIARGHPGDFRAVYDLPSAVPGHLVHALCPPARAGRWRGLRSRGQARCRRVH